MRRRSRKGTSWIAVLLVVVLGTALGIGAGSLLATFARLHGSGVHLSDLWGSPFGGGKDVVRILMLGEDNTGSRRHGRHGLSDTLVVMAVNTKTKEVRAISIPRDTKVEIPGHGTCKINSANAFGGPELARQVVGNLLGVDIDYYVATSTSGLRGLVDLVGGVYIKIDKNMDYDDRHQNLHIHLRASPEKQLLTPVQAEGYVRFRHDRVGDSGWEIIDGKKVPAGRIARQQIFMRALANRVLSLPTRTERAEVLSQAYQKGYIVSDLKLRDWDGLADYLKDIHPEKMVMAVLPGAPANIHGASYWIPDFDKINELVAQNMKFESAPQEEIDAKVEVLNGSGISGAAGKVADRLKEAGFQVTHEGNASDFTYDRCQVISHKANNPGAQRIAALLNCGAVQEDSSKGGADITVIVGRDFREN